MRLLLPPAPVTGSAAGGTPVREIQEASFRTLLSTAGIALLAWYALAIVDPAFGDLVLTSFVVLLAAVSTLGAAWVMRRSFTAARLLWLVGLAGAVTLALALFRRESLVYFYALLPLLAAAVTFRWQWGAACAAAVAPLLFLAAPRLAAGVTPDRSLTAMALGGAALVIGGALGQSLLSIAAWSMSNYRDARAELEEIREQRARLLQVQEDFITANTELARLTERLAAMTQAAEEARRIKEEFVARVSHELRTPLNMVIGFSEVIMKSPQLYGDCIPSALLADVDAILRNSQHLSRLVDDILDLSQVEAGRMALTKEWTGLPEVVSEAVSAVKGLFDAKGLYLREEIAQDLPPVFVDSTRIRQVVINLLGNAARFVERGGVTVRVARGSGEVTLSVTDTGPGISPADQSRVFEPFQQVDTALRRHKGGTGLGLTISRQFVEMHGGRMWLESEMGVGTTFFFTMPLRAPAGEGAEEGVRRWFNPYVEYEPRTHLANLPAPDVRPRYVLVENEEHLQRLFNRYADSVEVVGVRRVEDGVHEVQRSPARALVLNTPSALEDPQLKPRLAGLPFGTPVIACWLPGKEEAARKLGVVEYLVKPVTRQDVLSAVEKVPGPKRILLVDDEPEILRLFVRMLSSTGQGYTLIQAPNGQRALQLMRSRKPDLVLLDLVMPEMDGFMVLQEKSKDPAIRDIPVVVVSSLNPRGESSVSASFSVARGEGLSAHELLTCIQAVTDILVPAEQTAGRARAAETDVSPAS